MYKWLYNWAERYIYSPNFFDIFIALLLYPLSLIYKFIIICKKTLSKKHKFNIPIISIGNITLGGSGKTPLCMAIANEFKDCFIILRGYKRESKGLLVVCLNGEILTDTKSSGDEAMEYATTLENANVIVSENRDIAILKAKELGAKYILLDDGFGKFHIDKFDILIEPNSKPFFKFCIPSGGYRYPFGFYKFADFIAKEGVSHTKSTRILNKTKKMVLVTAIANPKRLDKFKNECVGHIFFPDHYKFKKDELIDIINKFNATSLLVTKKDFVKIKDFNLNLSLIELKTTLNPEFKELIKEKIL